MVCTTGKSLNNPLTLRLLPNRLAKGMKRKRGESPTFQWKSKVCIIAVAKENKTVKRGGLGARVGSARGRVGSGGRRQEWERRVSGGRRQEWGKETAWARGHGKLIRPVKDYISSDDASRSSEISRGIERIRGFGVINIRGPDSE